MKPTRVLFMLFLACLVAGCLASIVSCKRPPAVVAVTPCPPPPQFPALIVPVDLLHPGDPPDVVAQAYVASIRILRQAVKDRDAALDAYRPKPKPAPNARSPNGPP